MKREWEASQLKETVQEELIETVSKEANTLRSDLSMARANSETFKFEECSYCY